ncbi:DegT/DnrJ/EryC1/StrS family aminotransferase, partial [Escherichia coli]|uniref:DegT/DnrJ/EryC1/StrS family aminotransferase n=1 Tax=Escherichia coli TaxID=562 RepID=UPI00135DA34B
YHLQMTEFGGAVGAAQMDRLQDFVEQRQLNHAYLKQLAHSLGLDEHFILPARELDINPSWFGFALISRGNIKRNDICQWLDRQGVGNR